jgi:inward rectifier potassium channel
VLGLQREPLRDLYHAFLTRSWWWLLGAIALASLGLNALFALGYWLVGGVINAHTYLDHFYFSVQTSATVGYGAMYPVAQAAHLLVVAESVLSLIATALATGLVFAKFSRAPARFRFARHACVARHDGRPALMIRLGNQRGSAIVEAELHLTLTRTELTAEGEVFYRLIDLELARSRAPALTRSWTVFHYLDGSSPLAGAEAATLRVWDAELVVSVMGIDEVTLQNVHARHTYDHVDVRWGVRPADLLHGEHDRFVVDLRRFDDVVAETTPSARGPL